MSLFKRFHKTNYFHKARVQTDAKAAKEQKALDAIARIMGV